jgi:putative CocE/NonD family hydrolase
MSVASSLFGRVLGLPPARTAAVRVQRDIEIPMADGQRPLADRYHPADDSGAPLVLIRSPYGRSGAYGLMARIIAERGYQVLALSLRGTSGSGGRFDGFIMDPDDTPATLAWLRAQPWFPGAMATWGTSYLGYVQWELARQPMPEWKAAIIQDAPSEFYHSFMYPGGAFALGNALGWVQTVHTMFRTQESLVRQLVASLSAPRRQRRAVAQLPLNDVDRAAVGEHVSYFQQWIQHPDPDDYWARMDHRGNVDNMPPIVHLAGGWYDFFLPGMLADHAALRHAGRQVRLLVGPWSHGRGLNTRVFWRETFTVLDHALRGEGDLPAVAVRLFVSGAKQWMDFNEWPPPGYRASPWFLQPSGGLAPASPQDSPPSRFRYDPADPTPTVGGAIVAVSAGPKDNRQIETRADVLTFTSEPLERDIETIGPVAAEIHIRSTRPHTDVFARLCDVAPNGRSTNLCDGIVRLRADAATTVDEVSCAQVKLWPVGHRFLRGHSIRLQVSSGAHPRYVRNLGTGEQLGAAMLPADQEIFHDPQHPSAVLLPQGG